MGTNEERLAELTATMQRRPRVCPNCGSDQVEVVLAGDDANGECDTRLEGNRRCKACGCLWEPPWDRYSTYFAGTVLLLAAPVFLIGIVYGGWYLLTGEAFRDLDRHRSIAQLVTGMFVGLLLVPVLVYGGIRAIRYVLGKDGKGRVIRVERRPGRSDAD